MAQRALRAHPFFEELLRALRILFVLGVNSWLPFSFRVPSDTRPGAKISFPAHHCRPTSLLPRNRQPAPRAPPPLSNPCRPNNETPALRESWAASANQTRIPRDG